LAGCGEVAKQEKGNDTKAAAIKNCPEPGQCVIISGVAHKGPVTGQVKVYELLPDGGRGNLLATQDNVVDGVFELSIKKTTSPVVIAATGTYVDEATGSKVDMKGEELTQVVSDTQSNIQVPVTPATTFVVEMVREKLRKKEVSISNTQSAIEESNQAVARLFGVETATIKAVPSPPNQMESQTQGGKAAILMTALSKAMNDANLSQEKGVNPVLVLKELGKGFANAPGNTVDADANIKKFRDGWDTNLRSAKQEVQATVTAVSPSQIASNAGTGQSNSSAGTGQSNSSAGTGQNSNPQVPKIVEIQRDQFAMWMPVKSETVKFSIVHESSGGTVLTGHIVQQSTDNGVTWTDAKFRISNMWDQSFSRNVRYTPWPSDNESFWVRVSGLKFDSKYIFRVAGISSRGQGPFSSPSTPIFTKETIKASSPPPSDGQGFIQGIYAGAARGFVCLRSGPAQVRVYAGSSRDRGGVLVGDFSAIESSIFKGRCRSDQKSFAFEIPIDRFESHIIKPDVEGGDERAREHQWFKFVYLYVYAITPGKEVLLGNSGFIRIHGAWKLDPYNQLYRCFDTFWDDPAKADRITSQEAWDELISIGWRDYVPRRSLDIAPGNRSAFLSMYAVSCLRTSSPAYMIIQDYKIEYSLTNGRDWVPYYPGVGSNPEIYRLGDQATVEVRGLRNNNNYLFRVAPVTGKGAVLPWVYFSTRTAHLANMYPDSTIGRSNVKPRATGTFTPITGKNFAQIELGTVPTIPFRFVEQPWVFRKDCKNHVMYTEEGVVGPHEVLSFGQPKIRFMGALPNNQGYFTIAGTGSGPGVYYNLDVPILSYAVQGKSYLQNEIRLLVIEDALGLDIDQNGLIGFSGDTSAASSIQGSVASSCDQTPEPPMCPEDSYEDDNGNCQKALQRTLTFTGTHDKTVRSIKSLGSFDIGPMDLYVELKVERHVNPCLGLNFPGKADNNTPFFSRYEPNNYGSGKFGWFFDLARPPNKYYALPTNQTNFLRIDDLVSTGTVNINIGPKWLDENGNPFKGFSAPPIPPRWPSECANASATSEVKVNVFSKRQ
jgi:hypothetical protein